MAAASPALEPDDVHVWSIRLDGVSAPTSRELASLSIAERERALRYRREPDRRSFLRRRTLLRRILAGYLDLEPGDLRFTSGRHGKPGVVAGAASTPAIRFNLSHSEGLAVVAVSRTRELGVDVERVRWLDDMDALACRFFAPEEAEMVRRSRGESRRVSFFRCWTRKEAYLKGLGTGLDEGLDGFAVPLGEDGPFGVRHPRRQAAADRWSLHALEPAPGYLGALAVEGRPRSVATMRWSHGAESDRPRG